MLEPITASASPNEALVSRVIDCLRRAYTASLGRPLALSEREIIDLSLRALGMDSAATLVFLVEVEDEFGIEWDDDVPVETFTSVVNVAGYLADALAPR